MLVFDKFEERFACAQREGWSGKAEGDEGFELND